MAPVRTKSKVAFDHAALDSVCARFGISRLALFGSVLRDDFMESSDIDVLVAFRPGATPGLLRYADIVGALEEIFGRRVDLVTYKSLSPYLIDSVLTEAEIQYDEAG